MSEPSWRYFLSLEADLEHTTRYVEPCAANFGTYSIEFARLLLAACTEVEVVARDLCTAAGTRATKMDEYRTVLIKEYPHIHEIKIRVPRFALTFEPFSAWALGKSPAWWSEHQSVKHDRGSSFHLASALRCFEATSGLLALLAYLHQPKLFKAQLEPTQFFELERQHENVVAGFCELPDFDRGGSRIR